MTDDKKPTPPPPPPSNAKRIVRSLQGEDGFDIFADRKAPVDEVERLRRERDDNRP
jgi:hypothetical protein